MNARLAGKVFVVALVMALITPFAAAQEGPLQVGLRPDAPRYAKHGPYWVGVIEQEAETPSHPTTVSIWYPALNPDGMEETISYEWSFDPDGVEILPIAGHALRDATPDLSGGPYPLVVYVPSVTALRHFGSWLCEHLASYGFVVMAIDQVDSPGMTAGIVTMETRLQDVTWQIDYADTLTSAGGLLAGMIDTGRVAITGHSAGGSTAFEAGGAAGDPRVDAVVPLAPAATWEMSDFTLPTLLLVGSKDEALAVSDAQHLYESLGSTTKALAVLQFAHHFIFFPSCDTVPWLLPAEHLYCSDPVWDMDRAHDVANHFITAFLLNVLKGDEGAARFLRPGPKMDGIEY